jgi:hypothetical protein
MLFKEQNMSTIKSLVELTEEAPANAVGTGNIAGAGPGEDPPISMRVLKRHRNKNKQQANTVGRKVFHQMRS